jgi:transcriptional regulator with XRE-family HTH domain
MRQDWQRIIGANVRRLRKDRGLTQEDLAGAAELDVSYVRGIEAGRRNPSLMVMVALADALDAKPTDLFRRI